MLNTKLKFYILLLILSVSSPVFALPISYVGGTNLSQSNSILGHSLSIYHTLNRSDAFGAEFVYLTAVDFSYSGIQYARLLKRWNRRKSQGNLYFYASGGGGSAVREKSPARYLNQKSDIIPYVKAGFSADWESRFLYVYYGLNLTVFDRIGETFTQRVRFGFSPYKASYEKIQFWIILQVSDRSYTGQIFDFTPRTINPRRNLTTFTPYFRIFKDTYFFEIGYSDRQTLLFNMIFRL